MMIDENTIFDYSTTDNEFYNEISNLKKVVICEKCGSVNKYKNIFDKDGILVSKICVSCGKKNSFREFSKEEIVESFKLFKLFRRTSLVNGVEIGFIPNQFQLKFGGVFSYSILIPNKGEVKEIKIKRISTRDLTIDRIDQCFNMYYLKEHAIEYRKLLLNERHDLSRISDVMVICFENDSKFSYNKRSNYNIVICRELRIVEKTKNVSLYLSSNPKSFTISSRNFVNNNYSQLVHNLINRKQYSSPEIDDYFNKFEYYKGKYSDYLNAQNSKSVIDFYFSYDYSKKSDELINLFDWLYVKVEKLDNILSNDPTINYKVQVDYRNIDKVFYVYYSLLKSGFDLMQVLGVPVENLFTLKAIEVNSISSMSSEIERIFYLVQLLEKNYNCDQGELSLKLINKYSPFIVDKNFFGKSVFNMSEDVSTNKSISVYATYLTLIALRLGFHSSDDFYESDKYQEMKSEYYSIVNEIKQDAVKSRRKWKNELKLFTIAHHYYPSTIHQFKISNDPLIITDIYIPDLNMIIEYNGLQHYENISFAYKSERRNFEKQIIRDSNLRSICNEKSIELLEWPYKLEVTPYNFLILLNKLYLINDSAEQGT